MIFSSIHLTQRSRWPGFSRYWRSSKIIPSPASRLWNEQRRAGSLARFQSAVRLHGVLERVALPHFDFHLARKDDVEQVLRRSHQVFALGSVIHQARPREEQRAARSEHARVERRSRAGGVAEAH